MALPYTARVGSKYKSRLRKELQAMFLKLGAPQIFGTYSVNLRAPAFRQHLRPSRGNASSVVKDVAYFCKAFRREWTRVWKYIHKTWANKVVGGAKDYAWVIEFQQRGAPHVHYVMWTGLSADELISNNNSGDPNKVVVTCQRVTGNGDLDALVEELQTHAHSPQYCLLKKRGADQTCRFHFPKAVSDTTFYDEASGRVVIQRGPQDVHINAYNPDILRVARSNMDLQINKGERAVDYISKYISKSTSLSEGSVSEIVPPNQPNNTTAVVAGQGRGRRRSRLRDEYGRSSKFMFYFQSFCFSLPLCCLHRHIQVFI